MAWISGYNKAQSSGGGGGSSDVRGAKLPQTVTVAWAAGALSFTMSPVGSGIISNTVNVHFNDNLLLEGTDYSISGTTITILFEDDPANYGGSASFVIQYLYNA